MLREKKNQVRNKSQVVFIDMCKSLVISGRFEKVAEQSQFRSVSN
jgi:hypothetical protein